MSEIAVQTFNSVSFYKGYLPLKGAQQAQSYVVLALAVDHATLPYDNEAFATTSPGSTTPQVKLTASRTGFPESAVGTATGASPPLLQPAAEELPSLAKSQTIHQYNTSNNNSSRTSQNQQWDNLDLSSGDSSPERHHGIGFYLFRKRDLLPPPIRFYVSPKKVHRCFLGCEKTECSCDCIHIHPKAWRVRLDTLPRTSLTAAFGGLNVRLSQNHILPTAGYFFAMGLKAAKILPAVVPTMCRFNKNCRNGVSCLYIHTDRAVTLSQPYTSETKLQLWRQHIMDDAVAHEEMNAFYNFLDGQGVRTVGDMQVLGNTAFDVLAASVPPRWAEAFLTLSTLRNLDTKILLKNALLSFPRVDAPVVLPEYLETVGDLLKLTAPEFAQLRVSPFALDACALIRARYGTDETFNIIDLKLEEPDSFFSCVTRKIQGFCPTHAHCSWRKHDPCRPVVTSVLTFVDVNTCRCHRYRVDSAERAKEDPIFVAVPSDIEEAGVPKNSWCGCTRRSVIAVNYELSTPSGSRCSEQNAMGKLASMGVPTWAVREVFVHGMNVKKEVNPLFPCGVCENMLQKVTNDVLARYGGDVTLYMFDATNPRKIVFLTIPEISNRYGATFKKFVTEDLRDR